MAFDKNPVRIRVDSNSSENPNPLKTGFDRRAGIDFFQKNKRRRIWADIKENPTRRREAANKRTINRLLNTYDKVVERYSELVDAMLLSGEPIAKQADLLNNFKVLASIADPLMTRWNLVHRGYDNNARQAQEDARANTEKKEKRQAETGSLEDQIMVVGHYDPSVKELFENLPKEEKEKKTV